MSRMKRLFQPQAFFLLSCALGLFAYGAAVGHFHIFPYSILKFGFESVVAVAKEKDTLLGARPTLFLMPARHAGNGVTKHDAQKAAPGVTFITSFFEGGNELRLIRNDGSVVHRWPVRYSDYFRDPAHVGPRENIPRTDWNAEIHGALPLPDGSVVFNFHYLGTVKLDRCGQTQWTLPHMTHHAVSMASDGTLLIPSWRYMERRDPRFANLHPPYMEESILRVAQSGELLREISVTDILFKNKYQGLLARGGATGDIIHVNDVEELPAQIADRFPMFAPGDLMLSMRKGERIIVVDPNTLRIKWYQTGPWRGQHDPDFLPNGKILVFNNNDDGEVGAIYGGSNIMEVDPGSPEIAYRYGIAAGERMFTDSSGKHQPLPGGNVLVTESKAGRAFEAAPDGTVVWEFINRYDDTNVAVITEATRYPDDYFRVRDWSCPATPSR